MITKLHKSIQKKKKKKKKKKLSMNIYLYKDNLDDMSRVGTL